MKIDEKRNLTFPVVTERITKKAEGKEVAEEIVRVHGFHTPISREVFEANYRILAATKSALASKGMHYLMSSGPLVAGLALRDEGKKDAMSRGDVLGDGSPNDHEVKAFFAELKRLTMILCPGQNGWEMLPVDAAINAGHIDADDWREAESSLTFFTCNYAMARKADREATAKATASLLNASITSSNAMEFAASLPSLTPAESAKAEPSLIPS